MCCRCWSVRSTGAQLLAARRDREPAPAHQGRAVRGDAAVVQRLRGVYRGNGFVTVPRDSPVGVGCVCVCVVPSVVSALQGGWGCEQRLGGISFRGRHSPRLVVEAAYFKFNSPWWYLALTSPPTTVTPYPLPSTQAKVGKKGLEGSYTVRGIINRIDDTTVSCVLPRPLKHERGSSRSMKSSQLGLASSAERRFSPSLRLFAALVTNPGCLL